MKFARFSLVVLVMMVCATPLFVRASRADDDAAKAATAAPTTTKAATTSAKHASSTMSPEDMAKQATAKWKDTLKITDEQAPKFEAVMTDSYKKKADAKTAAAGDKTKMKASMAEIMKDRDAQLAQVLTPDQMKTYRAKMGQMSNKAKEHMAKASSEGEKEGDKH